MNIWGFSLYQAFSWVWDTQGFTSCGAHICVYGRTHWWVVITGDRNFGVKRETPLGLKMCGSVIGIRSLMFVSTFMNEDNEWKYSVWCSILKSLWVIWACGGRLEHLRCFSEHTWVPGSVAAEAPCGILCPGLVVWQLLLTSLALAWPSLKLPPPSPLPIASIKPTP